MKAYVTIAYQPFSLNSCNEQPQPVVGDYESVILADIIMRGDNYDQILNDAFHNMNHFCGASFENAGADHTSMSIGDIVKITPVDDDGMHLEDSETKHYICARIGWIEINEANMNAEDGWIRPSNKLMDYLQTSGRMDFGTLAMCKKY